MQNIYSDIDLIRYLYDETTPVEKQQIENSLKSDLDLKERISALSGVQSLLSENFETPSRSTIELIMDYSRSKSGMKTRFKV